MTTQLFLLLCTLQVLGTIIPYMKVRDKENLERRKFLWENFSWMYIQSKMPSYRTVYCACIWFYGNPKGIHMPLSLWTKKRRPRLQIQFDLHFTFFVSTVGLLLALLLHWLNQFTRCENHWYLLPWGHARFSSPSNSSSKTTKF